MRIHNKNYDNSSSVTTAHMIIANIHLGPVAPRIVVARTHIDGSPSVAIKNPVLILINLSSPSSLAVIEPYIHPHQPIVTINFVIINSLFLLPRRSDTVIPFLHLTIMSNSSEPPQFQLWPGICHLS